MRVICNTTTNFLILLLFFATSAVSADDDTLRLRLTQAPSTLIPHLSSGYKDRVASRIVYEPLATHDMAGNLIPVLASDIPSLENGGISPDGKTVVWKLKPGVRWADGAPFTAEDVCFTYEFIVDPAIDAYSATYYQAVESVTAVDALTVRITFKTPDSGWFQPFVGDIGVIVPRHLFKAHPVGEIHHAPQTLAEVGTGPFRLKAFRKEEMLMIGDDLVNSVRIIYEANPYFREKGKPFFKRVELFGGGDSLAAARAVTIEGAADYAWNLRRLTQSALADLSSKGTRGRLVLLADQNVERILLNFSRPNRTGDPTDIDGAAPHPFFSDKRVRQAFAHAVNRDAVAALYGEMAAAETNLLVAPEKYRSLDTAKLYPFDLKRAAELLDAAGWRDTDGDGIREKNGVPLRVVYQTSISDIRQKTQHLIKKNLEFIGVAVNLKFIDPSIFFSNDPANPNSMAHFNADMQEYSFGNTFPDPAGYMGMWICRRESASVWDRWRWCNDAYDALGRHLAVEHDPEKRRDIFIRMNNLLVKEVALIPLVNTRQIHAVGNSLENVAFTLWDRETWNVGDWRRKVNAP